MMTTLIALWQAMLARVGDHDRGSMTLEVGLIAAGIATIAIAAALILSGKVTDIFNAIPTG